MPTPNGGSFRIICSSDCHVAHVYSKHNGIICGVEILFVMLGMPFKGSAVGLSSILQVVDEPAMQTVHVLIVTYTEPLETVRCVLN
jgi:hypothetical protein